MAEEAGRALWERLEAHHKAGYLSLHMPGHKGVPFLGCENRDITEICGADELYEAEGIMRQARKMRTRFLALAGRFMGRRAPRSASVPCCFLRCRRGRTARNAL